jgi:hypothetical protein
MNKSWVLLAALSLPVSAADRVFTGSLERVRHASISIRMADGLVVDAVLPGGIAVSYNVADQVEITCTPAKTVYDAQAGRHYHLQLKSLRLVRTASPEERAETIELLSWQRGENLLKLPSTAVPAGEQSELDRVRQANLEYLSKRENFVADETARRYISDDAGKPWRLEDTIEDEIAFKEGQLTRVNIRKNGKPWVKPFGKLPGIIWGGFGAQIKPLFDPACPTKIDFAGSQEASGKPALAYLFISPPNACFGPCTWNDHLYNPARTGRILVDPARGSVIRYEDESSGFPEKFGVDRVMWGDSWDYVTIGGTSHIVPIASDLLVSTQGGTSYRVIAEYKNHRHFEASTNVTFH